MADKLTGTPTKTKRKNTRNYTVNVTSVNEPSVEAIAKFKSVLANKLAGKY